MAKLKSLFRWLITQFSLARLMLFIVFAGCVAAVVMSIGSQQIDEEFQLKPIVTEEHFRPVLPKGYEVEHEKSDSPSEE